MSIKFIWEMCSLSSIFPIDFLSGWFIHSSEWSFEVTYFMLLSISPFQVCSVQSSHSVVSDSWQPHGLQNARPPCPSPTPRVYSNSCPLSQWCHPTIILCRPPLLLPSIFPGIRVFSNESALRIRWPRYWIWLIDDSYILWYLKAGNEHKIIL